MQPQFCCTFNKKLLPTNVAYFCEGQLPNIISGMLLLTVSGPAFLGEEPYIVSV
jgi:hypothetical protein